LKKKSVFSKTFLDKTDYLGFLIWLVISREDNHVTKGKKGGFLAYLIV